MMLSPLKCSTAKANDFYFDFDFDFDFDFVSLLKYENTKTEVTTSSSNKFLGDFSTNYSN